MTGSSSQAGLASFKVRGVPCGCHPGTFEDGWRERRSDACVAEEREAFAQAIQASRFITGEAQTVKETER